ncbi:MAG: cytochrome P450 [Deltaproteobacteria bacterium]|nr:cytochrome P450 [Deltaproteobacteria bacterium]
MTRTRLDVGQFAADPFGTLRRARDAGGVVALELGGAGVMRHEQVRGLLTDPRMRADFPAFLRAVGVSSGPFYEWMAISPLNRDGAEHQRYRSVMSRTFTPRSVERLRPFLRRAAHELIDAFVDAGRCEFMAAFADPYPSLGLCELIGVPTDDRERFRGWANTIGLGFSPLVAMHIAAVDEALTQLLAYTAELAARRRAEPRDDLVSRIAQAALEDGWSDFEVHGFIAGLVFAGHETTKNQLGWTIQVLSEHPDLWDAAAAGTVAVADVVEEVLRFRSAVTGVGRTAAEPVDVDGERIAAGETVFLSVWSANHDERVFADPERVDAAHGAAAPHLAFGHGAHHCLGAALARAELQEALAALVARCACPTVEAGSVWRPPLGINGPERLPIRFARRASAAVAAD